MLMFHPDEVDTGILRELQSPAARWNVRESYANMAKRLRVDEETVRRRVSRMESLKVIGGWAAMPNPHLLGRESMGLYFVAPDDLKRRDLIEKLAQTEGTVSIDSFHDNSFLVFLEHPDTTPPLTQVDEVETLCAMKSTMAWSVKFPPFELEMTPTDWLILRALRNGPRRKLSEIAKEVGISARTLNRRMERLVEGNAFFVETLINFQEIGGLAFTLLVRCEDGERKKALDGLILKKLGGSCVWTDASSSLNNSLFSAFSDNVVEAKQTYGWVRSLEGVSDVRMGIQEEHRLLDSWIDKEIEARRSPASGPDEGRLKNARPSGPKPVPVLPKRTPKDMEREGLGWTGSFIEGRNVRVRLERDLCMGSGSCVAIAPKVFRLEWEKKKSIFDPAPLRVLKDRVKDLETILLAAQSCPYRAIVIEDPDRDEQLFP